MKREIDAQELVKFNRDSTIFAVLFIAVVILPIPIAKYLQWIATAFMIWLLS